MRMYVFDRLSFGKKNQLPLCTRMLKLVLLEIWSKVKAMQTSRKRYLDAKHENSHTASENVLRSSSACHEPAVRSKMLGRNKVLLCLPLSLWSQTW